ncbi:hypothetical protein CDL12_28322 [Handroanthus impetiginosus]|uniref:DUF7875 domain-containing protein n=1 Tax=Handroanthus impetiginosus TaxID=429701 RepID=A0A2G9G1I3_9LAMI|nr:hypothetical protein CDL12_28322 [Handroanthus impetiginosus]
MTRKIANESHMQKATFETDASAVFQDSLSSSLICFVSRYKSSSHDADAGPRITVPRSLRWGACGAVSISTTTALLVRLLSPECEPQNIAAYDQKK